MPVPKTAFVKNDPRINRKGRPPVGLSLADKVRAVVGQDGGKLVEMWAAIAWGRMPDQDGDASSSRVVYLASLKELAFKADLSDRVNCSKLLAERGFGKPKESIEHSGAISATTTVVHEYHDT